MAATPKPVRKHIKTGQSMSRKINTKLMEEGKSRLTPDKISNIKHLKHVHKVISNKEPSKKEIRDIKRSH